MKKLILGLTLLASMTTFAEGNLNCYSEVIEPKCSLTSQDPLTAPVQHWVMCKGYIVGMDENGTREAVDLYRQRHYYPEQNSIKRFFQVEGIADDLEDSIHEEVDGVINQLEECSTK